MSGATLMRLTKLLWQRVARAKNPWCDAMYAGLPGYRERWEAASAEQIEVTRAMFDVVFNGAPATEALLSRALDFLDGAAP